MTVFAPDTESFVAEFDGAIDAHLGWTHRILRCAVLRSPPGDDVLGADAHLCCRFGRWFAQYQEKFDQIDAATTACVLDHHEHMHAAVRTLCSDLLAGRQGQPADLDAFASRQTALLADLARLKTLTLARSARHDALTGLPLRYGLEEEFTRCRALATRLGQQMVLVMADLDHFKHVNDLHGHSVGDQALRHVAALLRAAARADEPVFRFGGEEFLAILHAPDEALAGHAAERLLQALRDAPLALSDGSALHLRASAGLVVVAPDEPLASALERADSALYAAKAAGRDCWRRGSA